MKKWLVGFVCMTLILLLINIKPSDVQASEYTQVDSIQLQQSPYSIDGGWLVDTKYANNAPRSMAKGKNEYLAVGDYGTIMKSTDGKEWSTLTKFANYQLTTIAWNGEFYIVAGANTEYADGAYTSHSELFKSKDGLKWEAIETDFADTILYITYGNNEFVASGGRGAYQSKDGVVWKQTLEHANANYYHPLQFVNNKYFMIVYEENAIYSSSDGAKWSKHKYDTNANVSEFIYFDGQYIGVNEGIYKSKDGISWSKLSSSPSQVILNSIITNGSLVVAMGSNANDNQVVFTSSNLSSWNKNELAHLNHNRFIIYPVQDGFAGLGYKENSPVYKMYSKNGLNWSHSLIGQTDFASIASNGKRIVAVGSLGAIVYSNDGKKWSSANSFAPHEVYDRPYFNDVEWGANKFVTVGNNGIYTSTDGISWSKNNSIKDSDLNLSELHWTGSYFIAAGQARGTYYSKDGVSWKKIKEVSGDDYWLMSMVSDGNRLIAAYQIYNNGNQYIQLMETTNGTTWKKLSRLNTISMELAFNGEAYVAVDPYNTKNYWVSKNAANWTKSTVQTYHGDGFNYVSAFDGYFIAFNHSNDYYDGEYTKRTTYYTSKDGLSWKQHDLADFQKEQYFGTVMVNDGVKAFNKYYFVGSQGYIISNDDLKWDTPINIVVNNSILTQNADKGKAFIENGVTYLPLRVIGEALDYEIIWNAQAKAVTFVKGGKSDTFNQVKLSNGLSYVPLRKVSEQLGYQVGYERTAEAIVVSITNK